MWKHSEIQSTKGNAHMRTQCKAEKFQDELASTRGNHCDTVNIFIYYLVKIAFTIILLERFNKDSLYSYFQAT